MPIHGASAALGLHGAIKTTPRQDATPARPPQRSLCISAARPAPMPAILCAAHQEPIRTARANGMNKMWSVVFMPSERHSFSPKGFYAGEYAEPQGDDLDAKIRYMISEAISKHKLSFGGGLAYWTHNKARLIEAHIV